METLLCIALLLMCLCALLLCSGLGLVAVVLWRRDDQKTVQQATVDEQQQKAAEVLAQWDNLLDYDGSPQPIPKAGDSR